MLWHDASSWKIRRAELTPDGRTIIRLECSSLAPIAKLPSCLLSRCIPAKAYIGICHKSPLVIRQHRSAFIPGRPAHCNGTAEHQAWL